jgi:hypothetical protein
MENPNTLNSIFQIATDISTPLALAGFICTILFLIFRKLLASRLLRPVTGQHTFVILMTIIKDLLWLSILALIAGGVGYVANLRFGNTNNPDLVAAGPRIDLNAALKLVFLDLHNIGKKPARRGRATLFGLNEDRTSRRKLAEADILGAGTNVLPGYNGHADLRIDTELPDLFLACIIYHDDDNNTLQKAFLFRLGTIKSNEASLDELEPPDAKACR